LIYRVEAVGGNLHVVLTVAVFSLNVLLMLFMAFKFIAEIVCKFLGFGYT
jgi:hypothetical protein